MQIIAQKKLGSINAPKTGEQERMPRSELLKKCCAYKHLYASTNAIFIVIGNNHCAQSYLQQLITQKVQSAAHLITERDAHFGFRYSSDIKYNLLRYVLRISGPLLKGKLPSDPPFL